MAPRRLRSIAVTGFVAAFAALGVAPAVAAQPPGDAAANLAAGGKLDAALALLDTWLADHPDDPRMFPVLLQVVTAAPRQPTVDAVVARYRSRLAHDQVAVLRAAPADLAELSGGVEQALQALELPGIPDAPARRAALLLELGQVTLETVPEGMPIVHAGLARSAEGTADRGLEPSLRAAFDGTEVQVDGGAAGAVAGYGLVSLLAANGRAAEAKTVLEQMRRRYPRSPEYALAAAELNAAAGLPRVVAFPSPAMLFGSLIATCMPPCPPPAVLLVRAAERPPQAPAAALPAAAPAVVTAPKAEPAALVVVTPEAEPVVATPKAVPAAVVATPEVEPVVATPKAEPAAVVVTPEPAAVVVTPEAEPVAVVAAPEAEPVAVVVTPEPVQVAAVSASSFVAAKPEPAPADPPVRVSTRPARLTTAATGSAADQISRRVSAVLASTGAAAPAARTVRGGDPVVRVAARPDPAAFIVQAGAYHDADNALELEHGLIEVGFRALARSYRDAGGGIVHRVAVGGNVTRTKADQLLAGLRDAGYDGFITRRDDVSYLPPPPPSR